MIITFLPQQIELMVDEGESVLNLAAKAGVLIDGTCGSAGKCGKCKVQVFKGNVPPIGKEEREILSKEEIEAGYRLACRLYPAGDVSIYIPQKSDSIKRKTVINYMPENFKPHQHIKKYFIKVEAASLENQNSDLDRLRSALMHKFEGNFESSPGNGITIGILPELISKLHELLEISKNEITAVIKENTIIALEAGDTTDQFFGIAFDIGTTSVVAMLWDLNSNEMLDVEAAINPQSIFGADVISRINFCNEAPGNLEIMQKKIIDCFNDALVKITKRNNIDLMHIYDATIVGNTTMSHLFLGVNPASLARSPFAPVFCDAVQIGAKDLEIKINPCAKIYVLPNIAGHVGSDIIADIISTDIKNKEGLNILIDVGTNGEIVLSYNGKMLACSTAAGPAFEGASIYQGMRAASGAVEGVQIINGKVSVKVIDDKDPIGICGSGLIDGIAEMLEAGIIDKRGRMLDAERAKGKEDINEKLLERLRKGPKGNEFVLAWGKEGKTDVVITQLDVREVQMAKGAIHAGINILLKHIGKDAKSIDNLIFAGAFGSYIKVPSALKIGLIPKVGEEKVISVGNAAGAGASMALLSEKEREKAVCQARRIEHIELAIRDDFQNKYLSAMNFA